MLKASDYLAGLTEAQGAAARATHGNVIVLAAPGSGKTHLLVGRIAALVREFHVEPSRVLAVTFTNAAVDGLKRRTLEVLGLDESEEGPHVCTFHSLGMLVLRRFWASQGKTKRTPATEPESRAVLDGLFKGANRRRDLQSKLGITRAKIVLRNWASGESLMKQGDGKTKLEREHVAPAKAFIEAYRMRHAERGMIAFDEIMPSALEAVESGDGSVGAMLAHYAHVLVDEAHDQTEGERRLIRYMMEMGANRMQVMDPRQRIFTWRGASIDLDDWQTERALILPLGHSFRCPESVTRVANACSHRFPKTKGQVPIEPRAPGGGFSTMRPSWYGRIKNAWGNTLWADEAKIAEVVGNAAKRVGPENVCVLARTNAACDEMLYALDVPAQTYQRARESMGGQESDIDLLMAAARLCIAPTDDYAFGQLAKAGWFQDAVMTKTDGWSGAYDDWYARVGSRDPTPLVRTVEASRFSPVPHVAHLVGSIFPTRKAEFMALVEAEQLADLALDDAVSRWALGSASLDAYKAITDAKQLTISTVHAARGREWPVVFVLTDPSWPGRPMPNYDGRGAEEWRLLFVALTRAERELTVVVGNSNVARLVQ